MNTKDKAECSFITRFQFPLRINPWWTDGCSSFISGLLKWYPSMLTEQLYVLEYGGGNSTLYLLSKGLKVLTVEDNEEYVELISSIAKSVGYNICVTTTTAYTNELLEQFDLVLIYAQTPHGALNVLSERSWSIVVNDGMLRLDVLQEIQRLHMETIIVLDNVEYCANWGRLDRTSAKPDLVRTYRAMIRDPGWRSYIFEQQEGRNGRGCPDKTGWESPHRWASAVLWPINHILNSLMVTDIGMPMVNSLGIDDADIASLHDRCPFDWNEMKWIKDPFPSDLDLKLDRKYD